MIMLSRQCLANSASPTKIELEGMHQNFPNMLPCYLCKVGGGGGAGQTEQASGSCLLLLKASN